MNISFYQFCPESHAILQNRTTILKALESCDTDLIVLPELAFSGYAFSSFQELLDCSELPDGKTATLLQDLSDSTNTAIVTGFAEYSPSTDQVFNSALCIRPGRPRKIYRKAHLFNTEKQLFTPGDTSFFTIDVDGISIGMLICLDHMFPEAARSLALQGAQIICHPSNLVLEGYAQKITRVRAMENHLYWILANRTGSEQASGGTLHFTGCSQIVAPDGTILASAGRTDTCIRSIVIDPETASDKRITPGNDLFLDRRTDLYTVD